MTAPDDLVELLTDGRHWQHGDDVCLRSKAAAELTRLRERVAELEAENARLVEYAQGKQFDGVIHDLEQRAERAEAERDEAYRVRDALSGALLIVARDRDTAERELAALKAELRRTCEHLGLDHLLADRDAWKIMSGGKQKIIEALEVERDALRSEVEFLHKRRGELVIERDRYKAALGEYPEGRDVMLGGALAELDALKADAERWRAALVSLWNLWSDPKWVRYKADYERGHLSYANMLDAAERPLLAAIDAARAGNKHERA